MPGVYVAAYRAGMAQQTTSTRDAGRCEACGGRITATHMLTKSYPVDACGRWQRRIGDFVEDVVVVCSACGTEPEGCVEAHGEAFSFTPAGGEAYA